MSSLYLVRKPASALGLVLTVILVAGLFVGAAALQEVQAAGGIVFDGSPGPNPPPATLGPYPMTPFPPDTRLGESVTSVAAPTGDVTLSEPMWHWSDMYTSGSTEVTMTLPPGTLAFYFYATDPTPDHCIDVTATAQDGTSGVVRVCGPSIVSGAGPQFKYFGFYSTGTPIERITVTAGAVLAVGRFGIYVAAPPIPTPPPRVRANVSVKIYGGWDGIPVKAWVGGTEQQTLYTARDAFGIPAVLWTFYPDAGWSVSVAPQLPAGLDPARWQFKLLRIERRGGAAIENPTSAAATIYAGGSEHVFCFQLVDTGVLPKEE